MILLFSLSLFCLFRFCFANSIISDQFEINFYRNEIDEKKESMNENDRILKVIFINNDISAII